jgi:hypothetical protein
MRDGNNDSDFLASGSATGRQQFSEPYVAEHLVNQDSDFTFNPLQLMQGRKISERGPLNANVTVPKPNDGERPRLI